MSLLRMNPEDFKVISGTDSLKNPRFTNDVCELIVHDKFNREISSINDIGIIKLCTPLEFNQFASPAHILNEEALPNFGTVCGFGQTGVSKIFL